jgi:hypothetical protein
MAISARGAFPYQLDKTVKEMFGDGLTSVLAEANMIFKDVTPDGGSYNSYAEISGLEQTRELGESEGPDYVVPTEGNKKLRYFTKYGLGTQATMEALDDELFGKIAESAKYLGQSAAVQFERSAFDILNSGNDTHQTADGQYIFSASHAALQSGTAISNLATAGLSETSLQAAYEYYDNMITSTGFPNPQLMKEIWIAPANRWTAQKLKMSTGVLSSANNDILTTNPAYGEMDWNYKVGHYLTDDDNWFALSDDPGLTVSWKRRPELSEQGDWETESKMYKVLLRFAVYCNKFQGIYGSFVA